MSAEGHFAKGRNKNNWKDTKYQSGEKGKQEIRCGYCHKKGHLKRDCYFLKKKQNLKNKKSQPAEASVGENVVTYSDVLAATDNRAHSSNTRENNDWLLDSGCSYHMTPSRTW